MSATDDWEGAARHRRPVGPVAAVITVALIAGLVLGRSVDSGPPPSDLVIEELSEMPSVPPLELQPGPPPTLNGQWRRMAAAPLRGRSNAGTAWTGSEVMVWGGLGVRPYADGALYDPVQDRWRRMSPAPLSARFNPSAVWHNGEVVIAGGTSAPARLRSRASRGSAVPRRDAAAYNPTADRWRPLPDLPFPVARGRMFSVDGRLYGVSHSSRERPVVVLDRGSTVWRLLPAAPVVDRVETAASVADGVLLMWPAGVGDALGLNLETLSWARIYRGDAPDSMARCECRLHGGPTPGTAADVIGFDRPNRRWWRHLQPMRPSYVGTDETLLYLVRSPAPPIAMDRASGQVLRLPVAPQGLAYQPVTLWTGRALVLWSGVNPARLRFGAAGLVFVPGGRRGPQQPYRL